MVINIYLNDMKFRYEVYQFFNIYYALSDINFMNCEEEAEYIVSVIKLLKTYKRFYPFVDFCRGGIP